MRSLLPPRHFDFSSFMATKNRCTPTIFPSVCSGFLHKQRQPLMTALIQVRCPVQHIGSRFTQEIQIMNQNKQHDRSR